MVGFAGIGGIAGVFESLGGMSLEAAAAQMELAECSRAVGGRVASGSFLQG